MTQESGILDLFGGISESNDFIPVKKDKYDDFANSKFEFSALGFLFSRLIQLKNIIGN